MARRRKLRGVLHSFLGTFASTRTRHRGYLAFGFWVMDNEHLEIDLRMPGGTEPLGPVARMRFWDQMRKHGLPPSVITSGTVVLERIGKRETVRMSRASRPGHCVRFRVTVTTDLGRTYADECERFVALHDPELEMCNA